MFLSYKVNDAQDEESPCRKHPQKYTQTHMRRAKSGAGEKKWGLQNTIEKQFVQHFIMHFVLLYLDVINIIIIVQNESVARIFHKL